VRLRRAAKSSFRSEGGEKMEVDQVITWLKQQMIMRELKELAAKPALSQRRKWRKRLSLCARIKRRLRK
jgi:hypothetical protein